MLVKASYSLKIKFYTLYFLIQCKITAGAHLSFLFAINHIPKSFE